MKVGPNQAVLKSGICILANHRSTSPRLPAWQKRSTTSECSEPCQKSRKDGMSHFTAAFFSGALLVKRCCRAVPRLCADCEACAWRDGAAHCRELSDPFRQASARAARACSSSQQLTMPSCCGEANLWQRTAAQNCWSGCQRNSSLATKRSSTRIRLALDVCRLLLEERTGKPEQGVL